MLDADSVAKRESGRAARPDRRRPLKRQKTQRSEKGTDEKEPRRRQEHQQQHPGHGGEEEQHHR